MRGPHPSAVPPTRSCNASESEHAHTQPITHLPDSAGGLRPWYGLLRHRRADPNDRSLVRGLRRGGRPTGHCLHPGLRPGFADLRRPDPGASPAHRPAAGPGPVRHRQRRQRAGRELHRTDGLARDRRYRRRRLPGHGHRRLGRRLHPGSPRQGHRHHHGWHGQRRGARRAAQPADRRTARLAGRPVAGHPARLGGLLRPAAEAPFPTGGHCHHAGPEAGDPRRLPCAGHPAGVAACRHRQPGHVHLHLPAAG
ncbi:hypothetical protein D9M71_316910 [compost metagenome]